MAGAGLCKFAICIMDTAEIKESSEQVRPGLVQSFLKTDFTNRKLS